MKTLLLLLMLTTSFAAAAACGTTTRAQAPQDQPTLVVPPVPPRVIEPPPPTEPTSIEAVPDLPTPPASLPRPKPTRDPSRGPESKPDTNKPDTPDPASSAQPPPAQPIPPLRTPTGADAETMRQIRETLQRARLTLESIDYRPLGNERRANYDAAKGWIKQAEDALAKEDLVLAKNLADRADTITKQLAGK